MVLVGTEQSLRPSLLSRPIQGVLRAIAGILALFFDIYDSVMGKILAKMLMVPCSSGLYCPFGLEDLAGV